MLAIIEDTRQKINKHLNIHKYFDDAGIKYIRCALPFGDYALAPKRVVDTKQDVHEVCINLCAGKVSERMRFIDEIKTTNEGGSYIIFLIEDKRFKEISDLYGKRIHCKNGRTISGDQLATSMHNVSKYYGCEFKFCDPKETGQRILELLENETERMDKDL